MSDPIPLILTCPLCRERHVDKGVFATKPHHTHACQHCGFTWRPAVVDTVGVQFLPGFRDEEVPALGEPVPQAPDAPPPAVQLATPPWRYLDARINVSDFGDNVLALPKSGLLECTIPDVGKEIWTQICVTLDSRLRRWPHIRVVIRLGDREVLLSERIAAFKNGAPMSLPRAYEVDYGDPGFAIFVGSKEDVEEASSENYLGMTFRLAAKTMECP